MVKAVLFDVFGTVVDWRGSVAREAQKLLAPKGHALDWRAFASRWRDRYQPAMEAVRSGARPYTILDVLHRENLEALLEEFAITGLSEAETDHLNRAWHRLDPWPDAVLGLTRLKRNYIVGTCSNGNIALMVNMARHARLPWDTVLGAEVARAYKPQPEAYRASCRALGLAPEEVMMAAAHNGDLHAAAREGMATAFIPRPTEHGSGQTADLEADPGFTVVASDFIDLADRLGCP